jgi:4-hydroxybenzoate polyprenyltransferase
MIARFLAFIRFSHTVFALPFGLGAMFVAAGGWPGWRLFGLVAGAMVCARTAAMTFNRIADWEIDKRNPRTEGRHRLVPKPVAVAACAAGSLAFVEIARRINPLCFALSPAALLAVFFYSFTKRFTSLAQFFLGLALAVAPVGGWIAVTGRFALPPLVLAAGVLCWVAGFDTIYALQDRLFDEKEGLRSLAVVLGEKGSLRLVMGLHGGMLAALCLFGWLAGLGVAYWCAMGVAAAALVFEQASARRLDVAGINRAFFQSNAAVSAAFLAGVIAGLPQAQG